MWEAILKVLKLDKQSVLKRKGIEKYRAVLKSSLDDLQLDNNEKREIDEIVKSYGLGPTDLVPCHREAFQTAFDKIAGDSRITDKEHAQLNEIIAYLGMGAEEFGPNQERFNRGRLLYDLEQGRLPIIPNNPTGIIFKEGEQLHFATGAALVKRKRQIQRVNYSGLTASIRITKGIRYRLGSIKPQVISQEYFSEEDTGAFYVTNTRVGFKGSRKAVEVPLSKVNAYEISEGALNVYRSGKENPHMFFLMDYDITMGVLSLLLEAN